MQIHRDVYLDYMAGRAVERPLFVELFGPLIGLEDEWRAQGAGEDEIALTAFGFDFVRPHNIGGSTGFIGTVPEVVLEETADHLIKRDSYGRTIKLIKKSATIALPLDFPVKDMESWLRMKPHYEYRADRIAAGFKERALEAERGGYLLKMGIPGGFDEIRELMGDEEGCVSYYTQPEVIVDILETIGSTAERVIREVGRAVPIHQLSVHEDLAGKSGPLIGPNIVDEFISAYYLRCWHAAQEAGAEIFQMDSDGNINPVIDAFMRAGVNSMLPFEPAAGMDIVAVRKKYGQSLRIVGGLDKFALLRGKDAIRADLEYKTQEFMKQGGVLFGLDHRIPNGVSIDNYRYYVKTARELLGLDPDPEPAWGRMAM